MKMNMQVHGRCYAAALTYVAGVCATLASMLRILFMILSSSNRDSN